jgi:hypothetical protein
VTQYFLGAHRAHWLEQSPQPLFLSHRTLRRHKALPRAACDWALDSGAFTELSKFGGWLTSAKTYAESVRRYRDEVGRLVFASPQDWMCEPHILKLTGLSVEEHQARTIDNYCELRGIAPDLPWVPVLQGWTTGDYQRHVDAYYDRGVELHELARVGVGSICRRSSVHSICNVLSWLKAEGLKLHAFGLKANALELARDHIVSADSMAWSFSARKEAADPLGDKEADPNELRTALAWFHLRIAPKLRAA